MRRLQQAIDRRAAFGVGAVAAQNPAVAEGAIGQAYGGAGQSGVTGKETIADAAHTRLELYQPGFRGTN